MFLSDVSFLPVPCMLVARLSSFPLIIHFSRLIPFSPHPSVSLHTHKYPHLLVLVCFVSWLGCICVMFFLFYLRLILLSFFSSLNVSHYYCLHVIPHLVLTWHAMRIFFFFSFFLSSSSFFLSACFFNASDGFQKRQFEMEMAMDVVIEAFFYFFFLNNLSCYACCKNDI